MTKTANGFTIMLASGSYFDFLDPKGSEFDIVDIALGLSNICRFTGQCRFFYTVAEHSVMVSKIVPRELALAGLLHDAAEAFIGDVSNPLKQLLPDYKRIEKRVEAAVQERFAAQLQGVPLDHPEIKKADLAALACERTYLMNRVDDWPVLRGVEPANQVARGWTPGQSFGRFLERYSELTQVAA